MWIWTLLMVFTVAICEEEKPNTILVFYMEKNLEQEEDFVELALTVNTKDYTLMKALNDARAIVDGVKTASNEYCLAEGGEECDSIVEVENYDIDFTYQRVKREPKYNGCVVKHEITITLRNTENIGVLVDRLLSKFGDSIIINGQEWKPEVEEDVEEKVIDEGLAQGRDLCSHIGKEMGDIIKIEQIMQQESEKQAEGENQGDEQDQEQEKPTILKFEVECVQVTETKSSKNGKKSKKK